MDACVVNCVLICFVWKGHGTRSCDYKGYHCLLAFWIEEFSFFTPPSAVPGAFVEAGYGRGAPQSLVEVWRMARFQFDGIIRSWFSVITIIWSYLSHICTCLSWYGGEANWREQSRISTSRVLQDQDVVFDLQVARRHCATRFCLCMVRAP